MTALIHPTQLQLGLVILIAAAVAVTTTGLLVNDWLERRRPAGWADVARQLGQRQAILHAELRQLADHQAHLAAEMERLHMARVQAARRPPSDLTLRLPAQAPRTAQMPRISDRRAS